MNKQLDFFYFIGSTYTYLAVSRAAELAQREGVSLNWRPFSVRTLMREQNNTPFAGKPLKRQYMWRDIERRALHYGLQFDAPPPYPIDATELANRVATVAATQGWCAEFTKAAFQCWFVDQTDPGEPAQLKAILRRLGHDADAVLAQADTEAIRDKYAGETAAARALGLFGSPTFACGNEIFWGDDRLEDALAWCKSH